VLQILEEAFFCARRFWLQKLLISSVLLLFSQGFPSMHDSVTFSNALVPVTVVPDERIGLYDARIPSLPLSCTVPRTNRDRRDRQFLSEEWN